MASSVPLGVERHEDGASSEMIMEDELGQEAQKLRLEEARLLLSAAAAFGLEDCWKWKPLMDGKQVSAL